MLDRAKVGLTLTPNRPAIHSFSYIAEKYIMHLRRRGAGEKHLQNVEKHTDEFAALHGKLPIIAITSDLIATFLDGLLEGRAVETVKKYRTSLHGFFQFALQVEKVLSANPVSATIPPRDASAEDSKAEKFVRSLPPERDRDLLDTLPAMAACAAAISLYHGQRLNAVVSLRVGGPDPDVDLIGGVIRFRGETLKRRKLGAKPRKDIVVKISRKALHYVTEQAKAAIAAESIWLHPSPKNSANASRGKYLSLLFQKPAVKAGFEHAYFHGLLHVHTNRVHDSGQSDVDGKALAAAQLSRGHDGSEVTKRYIHTSDRDRWAVQARMDAWLDEQVEAAKVEKGTKGGPRN